MTFSQLRALIVAAREGIFVDDVVAEARLAEDLGLDSLDRADLLLTIEDAFSVDLDDQEYAGMRTVGDLVSLVDRARERVVA